MEDRSTNFDYGDAYLDLHHLRAARSLECLLGRPLPVSEKKLWLAMSKAQRERAMKRMKAIVRWQKGGRFRSSSDAAGAAELTPNHFYEMAKAWKEKRSLASLEVLAGAPRARSRDYETVLDEYVKTVVGEVPAGSKVTLKALAEQLGAAAAGELKDPPSFTTLRRKVQEELRRRERALRPGEHLQFDCCAVTMSTLDKPQRTMFAVIDARTQLVLGVALGRAQEARLGYASAAQDALRRLASGSLSNVAWAVKLEKVELVTGLDDDLSMIGVESARAGIRAVMQPAIALKRFGRYLRKAAGDRMGRILFLSSDTLAAGYHSLSDLESTSDDAARFQVEIEIHNAAILAGLEDDSAACPPAELIATLHMFVSWRDRTPL